MKTKRSQVVQKEESPTPAPLLFFQRYKRTLSYLFFALILAAAFIARTTSRREVEREHDFRQAQANLHQVMTGGAESGAALAELEQILQRHNELHPSYDGLLAQVYLKESDPSSARYYAEPLLERTTPLASHYATFSQGSLLIAEERYQEALGQALLLRDQLHSAASPLLKAHNLLRIALLQEELGNNEAEQAAWDDLLDELARGGTQPLFYQSFSQGSLTLADYARARSPNLH